MHLRDKLRTIFKVEGHDVTVYEERPRWDNPQHWTSRSGGMGTKAAAPLNLADRERGSRSADGIDTDASAFPVTPRACSG